MLKSFRLGNKAFCISKDKDSIYLYRTDKPEKVESLHALKNILINNVERIEDARMVEDILSVCTSRRPGKLLDSNQGFSKRN